MVSDSKKEKKEKKAAKKLSKEDLKLIAKIGKKAFNELKAKEAEEAALAQEAASIKDSEEKIQEVIPEPVKENKSAIISQRDSSLPREPLVKTVDKPVVQNDEQTKKEEKKLIKLSKVIEMSEIAEIKNLPGVKLYTLERLMENGANRETPGKIVSWNPNELKIEGRKYELPHEKIGSKITSTFKISDEKGVPIRFKAIVPGELIGTTRHINKRGKQPEYDFVMLIPENIPGECDPRRNKKVTKILRVNGNARDNLKSTEQGYICEVEIGFKKTDKFSDADSSLSAGTYVPYVNMFPRSGKIEGPEYVLRVLMGPIEPSTVRSGSLIIGPSNGLQILRGENVEAVTLYAILERIDQPVAQ